MFTHFFYDYGLFLAKSLTIVLAVVLVIAAIAAVKKMRHTDERSQLKITSLNERFTQQKEQLYHETLDKKALKAHIKAQKKKDKAKRKNQTAIQTPAHKPDQNQELAQERAQEQAQERDQERDQQQNHVPAQTQSHSPAAETKPAKPRLFVLDFDGDIQASAIEDLRDHISAVIQFAEQNDEVLLRLESGGGFVHAYGLAASQLARLREHNIRLVVSVDMVAASGGYMMACVADELRAAPFAILGSVGVIGAVPNFHNLLKKNAIDYEQHTAGKYKRSLTMFGENTPEDREQFKHELAVTHELFKQHIAHARPQLDVDAIATGETWYGVQALNNGLIDAIGTSDDYILAHLATHQILLLEASSQETLLDKLKAKFLGQVQATSPFKTYIQ